MKKVALVVSTAIVCLVSIIKNYWAYIGGFISGDEALYFHGALLSVKHGKLIAISARHHIFQLTTMAAAFIFNLDNIFDFIIYMLVHCVFWNTLCLYVLFKILSRVTSDDRAASLTLLSVPFILAYTVLNAMYLSEAPSLFFCLLGINLMLRFTAAPTKKTIFLASLAFVISSFYREPFLVFIAMNLGLLSYWIVRRRATWSALLLFMLPLIVVPFPADALAITTLPNKSLLDVAVSRVSDFQLSSPIPVSEYEDPACWSPVYQYHPDDFLTGGIFTLAGNLTERLVTTTIAFARGMTLGWSALFTAILFASILVFILEYRKNRTPLAQTVLVNASSALLSFVVICCMISVDPYVRTGPASSICLRFSYTTLPALILFPYLYGKIKVVKVPRLAVLGAIAVATVSAAALAPQVMYALQSNQSLEYVNRLNPSYRGPYYRLYQYIIGRGNDKLAVFPEPAVRASLYIWVTDADLYRIMVDGAGFAEIVGRGYDAVLFYGEKWYRYYDTLRDNSPFYFSLIQNQTRHKITVVWDDPESHLYVLEIKK